MGEENVTHFLFGYSLQYGSHPNNLLPSSNEHFCIRGFDLRNIYHRCGYFQKTTGLYVEVNIPIVVKILMTGLFNNKDELTFERIAANLFKCNQHFSEMNSLTDQNEYLIDLKFCNSEGIEKSLKFSDHFRA